MPSHPLCEASRFGRQTCSIHRRNQFTLEVQSDTGTGNQILGSLWLSADGGSWFEPRRQQGWPRSNLGANQRRGLQAVEHRRQAMQVWACHFPPSRLEPKRVMTDGRMCSSEEMVRTLAHNDA
eukprot:644214-Rhodomonas_salina.1